MLEDNGKVTHIDHATTFKELLDKVLQGKLTFDEAYLKAWDDSNLRAVHTKCNYGRNAGRSRAKKNAITRRSRIRIHAWEDRSF